MNHIPIYKLSEFYDDILDAHEKEEIKSHLDQCPECQKHFEQLHTMVNLLSCLQTRSLKRESFALDTIQKIKKHHAHKRYYATMRGSFIAAIILLAIITFLPESIKHDTSFENIAKISNSQNDQLKLDCIIPVTMDFNTALLLLQQNNARILHSSESYIIAESDVNSFSSIRQMINGSDSYRKNILSDVAVNHTNKYNKHYPQLTHANKKKYIFRLQLR